MIAKMDEAGVEKVFITQCKMWSYRNKWMYYMDTKLEEVAQYTRPYPDRFVGLAALGGGCESALAVDFRIASETARFGLPENQDRRFSRRWWHAKVVAFDRRRQSERNDPYR